MTQFTRSASDSKDGTLVSDPRDGTPILSDSHIVVREMEQARGRSLTGGLFTLMRANFDAWMEERMKLTILRRLDIRSTLAQKHSETINAETTLRGSIVIGMTDDQKRLFEFNTARKQRLLSDLQTAAGSGSPIVIESDEPPTTIAPPVMPHLNKDQIEALALKAVMNLGGNDVNDEEWKEYRKELFDKLPENLAKEVERRINELRSVIR